MRLFESCEEYISLFVIAYLIMIDISSTFICFYWYLKKSNTSVININYLSIINYLLIILKNEHIAFFMK